MKKTNVIVVCSHSVYPHVRSSEGIVNRNWFDILSEKHANTALLSSEKSINIINGTQLTSTDNKLLKAVYDWSKSSTKSVAGLLYQILNKISLRILKLPKEISLYQIIWVKIQTKKILRISSILENSIFWSRILPTFSILPILEVWNQKRIPFIININDPLQGSLDNDYTYEEKILIDTVDKAQCWTFPSQRLADLMATKYNLDRSRCFVIPHAMRKQEEIYNCNKHFEGKLKFVYTGTFYKSAFSDFLEVELVKFSLLEEMEKVEFIFILSQYDDYSLQWIRKNIPNAKILTKLFRNKVLEITSTADCMLVIDSVIHQDLLKGKLIEAISQGLPIFGVTYQNSVMDDVIKEYGGISSYHNVENDISDKLRNLIINLEDRMWLSEFHEQRKSVMEKISEGNIAKATIDITQYAFDRFLWQEGKSQMEPIMPKNYNWP